MQFSTKNPKVNPQIPCLESYAFNFELFTFHFTLLPYFAVKIGKMAAIFVKKRSLLKTKIKYFQNFYLLP